MVVRVGRRSRTVVTDAEGKARVPLGIEGAMWVVEIDGVPIRDWSGSRRRARTEVHATSRSDRIACGGTRRNVVGFLLSPAMLPLPCPLPSRFGLRPCARLRPGAGGPPAKDLSSG